MSETPDNNAVISVLGAKMDHVQKTLDSVIEDGEKLEIRIRANEVQLVGLNQRFGWVAGILGSLQVVTISIATWLGLKG